MAPSLLRPQAHLSNQEILELAQQAPSILRKNPRAFETSPLLALFTASENTELWIIYENLLLACLRIEDDRSAVEILARLALRFGDDNQRIMALKGLVREAQAKDNAELEEILKGYETVLIDIGNSGTNIPIAKRRVALLKSLGRPSDAISALVRLLEYSPTDAEAWSELSDLYLAQGMYAQAIYALEEVLVLSPNSWNMQARLGELLFMAAAASADAATYTFYAESVKRFCRSIELCDDYLRGYYGLKQATDKLLSDPKLLKPSKQSGDDGLVLPPKQTLEALNEQATKKLAEIVRRYGAGDPLWQGYDVAEVAAARELLSKGEEKVVR
ncbi:related to kinetoplast-associated protein KAP [Cephalotrichum gorgonifer]|uniref:ER membrane protein complex subunit 2 n=1 Tax=Cephalotrichum gorgonifer TaxID=2041049 RepID=A0AAE8MV60_9PEZI|nr:related to kinetoplast-associated protein KAP [Cephalotrichum gorgonifer]